MADARAVTLHPVQLVAVWLIRSTTSRIPAEADAAPSPTVQIPRARLVSTSEGRDAFVCAVRVQTTVPFEGDVWSASATVSARFTSERPLLPGELRSFLDQSVLYVVWPFARAAIYQLAALSGVSGPPLPMIVWTPSPAALSR